MPRARRSMIKTSSSADHLDCFLAGGSTDEDDDDPAAGWRRLAGMDDEGETGEILAGMGGNDEADEVRWSGGGGGGGGGGGPAL